MRFSSKNSAIFARTLLVRPDGGKAFLGGWGQFLLAAVIAVGLLVVSGLGRSDLCGQDGLRTSDHKAGDRQHEQSLDEQWPLGEQDNDSDEEERRSLDEESQVESLVDVGSTQVGRSAVQAINPITFDRRTGRELAYRLERPPRAMSAS